IIDQSLLTYEEIPGTFPILLWRAGRRQLFSTPTRQLANISEVSETRTLPFLFPTPAFHTIFYDFHLTIRSAGLYKFFPPPPEMAPDRFSIARQLRRNRSLNVEQLLGLPHPPGTQPPPFPSLRIRQSATTLALVGGFTAHLLASSTTSSAAADGPSILITRKRFPFCRYSFREDGSLVVREKQQVNRDSSRSQALPSRDWASQGYSTSRSLYSNEAKYNHQQPLPRPDPTPNPSLSQPTVLTNLTGAAFPKPELLPPPRMTRSQSSQSDGFVSSVGVLPSSTRAAHHTGTTVGITSHSKYRCTRRHPIYTVKAIGARGQRDKEGSESRNDATPKKPASHNCLISIDFRASDIPKNTSSTSHPAKKYAATSGSIPLLQDCSTHNRSHRAALSTFPHSETTGTGSYSAKTTGLECPWQDRIREALAGDLGPWWTPRTASPHERSGQRMAGRQTPESSTSLRWARNVRGQTSKLPTLRRFTLTATAVGKIEEGKIAHPISKQLEISSHVVIPTGNQQPRRAIPTTAPRRLTMPSDQFLHTVYLNRPGKLPGTQSKYFSSRLLDMEQSTPPTPFNYHPLDSNAINPVATLPVDALTCVCEQLESSSAKDVTMLKHEVNQTNYSARRFNTRRPLNFSRGSLNPFLLSFSPSPAVALPACGCSHPPSPTITSDQDLGCRALSLMEAGWVYPHTSPTEIIIYRTSLITANENTHNAGHYIQLFPQGDVSFHFSLDLNLLDILSLCKLASGHKRSLSPLAVQGHGRQKVVCPSSRTKPQTASAPGSVDQIPKWQRTPTRARRNWWLRIYLWQCSANPFKKAAAPPDDNIAPLESDCCQRKRFKRYPPRWAVRGPLRSPHCPTPRRVCFFPIRSPSLAIERSAGEIVLQMTPWTRTKTRPVPHGSRVPFVAISSREHSTYRSRRRGSLPGQPRCSSHQPTTGEGTQTFDPITGVPIQPQHSRTSIADIRLNDIPEDIGSPTGPTDTPNGLHGGTAPGVSTRAPSNPLRPIRTRGAFIIGNISFVPFCITSTAIYEVSRVLKFFPSTDVVVMFSRPRLASSFWHEMVAQCYSELQNDRRVFEKTGLYLNSKSDGNQNRVSMDGAVGRQTTESTQFNGPERGPQLSNINIDTGLTSQSEHVQMFFATESRERIGGQQNLQEDHDTLKKGFNRLLEMHIDPAGKITTLKKDFDQCRELKVQLEARLNISTAQIIAANQANSMRAKYGLLPPSTSFTFNQPVVLASLPPRRATTCPACRVDSVNLPQRDYALSDILPLVYEAQGATVPTTISENFDPKIFVTIYADKAALLVGRQGGGLGRLGGGPGRPGGGPGRPGEDQEG
ncbi:hypothetical protein BJ322DRAFT_1025851, partial [Thelephora terrestris]